MLCAQDGASEGAGAGSGNAVEGAGRRARQCSCSEHFGCVKMRIREMNRSSIHHNQDSSITIVEREKSYFFDRSGC